MPDSSLNTVPFMGEQPDKPSSDLNQPGDSCGNGESARPKSKNDWMKHIDADQTFRLVDSILPFEACLYHQILPIAMEGSRLKLGMVNLDDTTALDYVRRILAYMNCSLVPQAIASDVHYAALSAYLSYVDQKKQTAAQVAEQPVARRIAKKLAEQSAKRHPSGNAAREGSPDPSTNPTLLVDSPSVLPVIPIEEEIGAHPHDLTVAEVGSNPLTVPPQAIAVQAQYLHLTPDQLIHLDPTELFEELLGRVLGEGIGRLYLETAGESGRILWSQDGIVQAAMENAPLATVKEVLQELKLLMHLSPVPTQKPKQIELDCTYQEQRLLLRLRLGPNKQNGEKATLQVLRGAALSFYRQQQLVLLGQEVQAIAQQLQQKMSEVYNYSRSHQVSMPSRLGILAEVDRTLKRVSHQVTELQNTQFQDPGEDLETGGGE